MKEESQQDSHGAWAYGGPALAELDSSADKAEQQTSRSAGTAGSARAARSAGTGGAAGARRARAAGNARAARAAGRAGAARDAGPAGAARGSCTRSNGLLTCAWAACCTPSQRAAAAEVPKAIAGVCKQVSRTVV